MHPLQQYPDSQPDIRPGCDFSLPLDEGPDNGDSNPTFAEDPECVRTNLVPFGKHFDNVHGHMMDMRRDFRGMQEISAANEGVLCQKFEGARQLSEGNIFCQRSLNFGHNTPSLAEYNSCIPWKSLLISIV